MPVLAAAQNGQLAALRLVLAAPGGEEAVNQQNQRGEMGKVTMLPRCSSCVRFICLASSVP